MIVIIIVFIMINDFIHGFLSLYNILYHTKFVYIVEPVAHSQNRHFFAFASARSTFQGSFAHLVAKPKNLSLEIQKKILHLSIGRW